MTLFDAIFTFLQSRVFGNSLLAYISTDFQQTNGSYLNLRDYICLIGALFFVILILALCCLLIKKIYNMCAHIIG